MLKVKDIIIERVDNAGCNNGNYPKVSIVLGSGETLTGRTCNCNRGCSGTWCLPRIGCVFADMDDLHEYLDTSDDEEDEE